MFIPTDREYLSEEAMPFQRILKITDDIFQVGGDGFTSHEDAAAYLVRFADRAVLIDSGCGRCQKQLIQNIETCLGKSARLEYLLLTHCHFDHSGGAHSIRKRFGCPIIAHEKDAAFLEAGDNTVTAADWYGAIQPPLSVDRKLSEPETDIPLGPGRITAYHIPGHTPGSLVYLTESGGLKVLFAQDVHGPLDPSFLSSRKDYQASLRLLLSLEADILCEGHFGIYRGKKDVDRFIRSFMEE